MSMSEIGMDIRQVGTLCWRVGYPDSLAPDRSEGGKLSHYPRRRGQVRQFHLRVGAMKPTKTLHDLGQSLWLDNLTRALMNSGTLKRYIDALSVTGLTSNPTIFDHAIKNSADYDRDISELASRSRTAEDLFIELALADLTRAAELFRPTFERTNGVDGWVSLEVSPRLAHNTDRTLLAARNIHENGGVP